MNRISRSWVTCGVMLAAGVQGFAQAQKQAPTPAQSIAGNLNSVNQRVLEMAKDFPEDKYGFRPSKEVRSFGEVILHIMAGNAYAAQVGRGEKANWEAEEVNPKLYKGKAEIVAAFQKSVDDATASLKAIPPEQFTKSLAPWVSVIEHAGEHYGQLVVYYRLNGMVPPASRPQPKKA
jgi:uncharacterized damage-inducible protein DinB